MTIVESLSFVRSPARQGDKLGRGCSRAPNYTSEVELDVSAALGDEGELLDDDLARVAGCSGRGALEQLRLPLAQ